MSRLLSLPILILIRAYQLLISPFLGGRCRFYPSCSNYALECFQVFPFHLALWYAGKRLLRCHPFHSGGFDPIPTNGNRKSCSCTHEESN